MNQYKLTLLQVIKLHTTNKDFVLFDVDINNNVINIKLTDDLLRYKNKYKCFKVLTCIKPQLNTFKII